MSISPTARVHLCVIALDNTSRGSSSGVFYLTRKKNRSHAKENRESMQQDAIVNLARAQSSEG
jgi:hypothetical protein